MDSVHNQPKFNWDRHDLVEEWSSFKTHASFMFAGPLSNKTEEQKCAYLMIWMGEKGRKIFSTWNLSADDKKKLDVHYDKFRDYVQPKTNPIFARYKFHCRTQDKSEPVEQFVTDLKTLAKDCSFGDKEDENVRDRIVFGIQSQKAREKLFEVGKDLTLAKATEIARIHEISVKQLKELNEGASASTSEINAVKERKEKQKQKKSNHSHQHLKQCTRCGLSHPRDKCPAKGKTCSKCKKMNHFAKRCFTKNVHNIDNESETDSDSSILAIHVSTSINSLDDEEWSEIVKIEEKKVKFELDTGAKCNVISHKTFQKLNTNTPIKPTKVRLTAYTGHKLQVIGTVTLKCRLNKQMHNLKFFVTKDDKKSILSRNACQSLGLIKRCKNPSEIDKVEIEEFHDAFEGLGCLPGVVKIKVDTNIQPVVHPPRKVPIALRDRVKQELEKMVDEQVITPQTEPTDWVNSMVVVESGQKLRICLDPKDLNKAIKREHYPMKTIEDVVENMKDAKIFSKLDATHGYWHLKLDEESSKLCTFNTPFGRYRFLRVPFGISSASEIFQREMNKLVEDIEGAEAIQDDIIIYAKNDEEHDEIVKKVIKRGDSCGLKFNKRKCEFGKEELKYVGHVISKEGLKADPEKVRAVKEMKQPEDVKELMTFLGFIQYLSKFIPNLSDISAPLRKLTQKDSSWKWGKMEEEAFNRLKNLVSEAPVLRYYDPKLPLTLSVDASKAGLGCVIMQEGHPIAYGSRALTKTQQNYAQIEKETLALVFGCTKFHQYIYGRKVHVETDHKPLQSIFSKPLQNAPARLQRFLLQLQKYDLDVKWKPGKELFIADTLSRSFLQETKEELESECEVNTIKNHLSVSDETYTKFQSETAKDQELCMLKQTVLEGWPNMKNQLPTPLRQYWSFRDEITHMDGILFKGDRIIVPNSMRHSMIQKIHETHFGIVKCKNRARQSLYWPGMSTMIENSVSSCRKCAEHSKANAKEPMIPMEIPDRQWSKIGTDLFEYKGTHYLLTVDYYSKWPEFSKLDNLSAKHTISHLKSLFSRYGYVDEVVTDNGPQFSCAEFQKLSKEYEFKHTTVSPKHPQGNGQIERTVQTIKNILKKAEDPHKALLDYRNTPLENGLSPAQMFLNRQLKTSLPTKTKLLKSKIQSATKIKKKLQERQQKQKFYFDKKAGKQLSTLKPGDHVFMSFGDTWKPAEVVNKHSTPRSYIVRDEQNRTYRRNRNLLRPTKYHFNRDHTDNDYTSLVSDAKAPEAKASDTNPQIPKSPQKEKSVSNNENENSFTTSPSVNDKLVSDMKTTRSGRVIKTPLRFQE